MANPHAADISGVPQPAEKRIANDGALYTRAQFESHYGARADWYWKRAATPTQALGASDDDVAASSSTTAMTMTDDHCAICSEPDN